MKSINHHNHSMDLERKTSLVRISKQLVILFLLLLTKPLSAFPPAPHHEINGMIRDEYGNPLSYQDAELWFETPDGVLLIAPVNEDIAPGINYRFFIPMDSAVKLEPNESTALQPTFPFRIRARIEGAFFLPIEMTGDLARIGEPAGVTRLNLTLGEDLDGDGLPDAWERMLLAEQGNGKTDLNGVDPTADSDQDGMSNLQEYLSGTYAFDPDNGFKLTLVIDEQSHPGVEFMAIIGRTYTLYGSNDLESWNQLDFFVDDVSSTVSMEQYRAEDVRNVRARVDQSVGSESYQFFKLMVE